MVDDDFSLSVVRDLYEGLTALDARGEVVPGVADHWDIDRTQTLYTFHIRPTAKWSNGTKIVAEEFVQGMRRAVNPTAGSGGASLLAIIKGANKVLEGLGGVETLAVTAHGLDEVRIELEHPAPYFLKILSQPIAAPLHVGSSKDAPLTLYNGAYTLTRRIPGSLIDLSRNPFYWDASRVAIDGVRYVNAESEETEMREYLAGQLDITYTIPLMEIERLKQEHSSEVQMTPSLGVAYLALNLSDKPFKDNPNLRKALSIAVDRDLIAKHLLGGASPAYSFLPTSLTGYTPARYVWASWPREQQLKLARSLYNSAGYSSSKPLRLRLYYSNNDTIHLMMIAIAESWRHNLGIDSQMVEEEFRVFLAGRRDRSRWDVLRLRWDADYDDPSSFLETLATGNNQNDSKYSNQKFDLILAKAKTEEDASSRLTLYKDAEQIILEENPVIPVYFPLLRRLVSPDLVGADIRAMNKTYSKNLSWTASPHPAQNLQ